MNNATVIIVIGVLYAAILNPWWLGLVIGLIVGLLSCLFVDGLWLLMRKLATR